MRISLWAGIVVCGLACGVGGVAVAQEGAAVDAPAKGVPVLKTGRERPKMAVPDLPVVKRTELEGGLVVEDMRIGDGALVKAGDMIVAHYHGTLREGGTEFDSSYRRGEPLGLPLTTVIPGWQKGVPGMKVGGVRRLTVPAAMAYGDKGAGPVPSNADLVFVMEVVDMVKVEEIKAGTGEAATGRCVAITAHTITGKDGAVIERRDASDPYIWVRGEHPAMAFALEGMKRGGKRKVTIPAALNRTNPGFGTDAGRPEGVAVTIEFELLNVKNIPPEADAPGC